MPIEQGNRIDLLRKRHIYMELEYMTERRDYSVSEALKLAEWI